MSDCMNFNIGMVLDDKFPPDTRVEKEIRSLTSAGFKVIIICFTFGSDPQRSTFYGADVIRIKINRTFSRKMRGLVNTMFDVYTIYWAFHLKKFVKEYCIDVLHIHDLYLTGAGLRTKKALQNKVLVIGDLHENYADALKYYKFSTTFPGNILISKKKWKITEKKWISRFDRAIVVVEEMKNRISKYINPEKIVVCENCPPLETYKTPETNNTETDKYEGKFVISYIGAFDWHRGIDTLIDAMHLLKKYEDITLCIVGDGKIADELKQKVKNLKLTDKVYFEGWKSPEELPSFFSMSNLGVIPHLKSVQTDNSSPNKIFQYMYYEVPVVSTNCNSLKRIIEVTKAGIIYESGNADDLCKKIEKLYKNQDLRTEMAKNGKESVIERYNWEYCSKDLIQMYSELGENYKHE